MPDEKNSIAYRTFFEIAGSQERYRIVGDDSKATKDPRVTEYLRMHDWSKREETAHYVERMEERIRQFESLENRFIDSHARLAYYKGIKDALAMSISEIEAWSADTPHQRTRSIA